MYVFCVRRFNDIDHLTPVIAKFFNNGHTDLMIICLDAGYNVYYDPNIQYLKKTFGIRVEYGYTIYTPSLVHTIRAAIIKSRYKSFSWSKRFAILCKERRVRNIFLIIAQIFVNLMQKVCPIQITDKIKEKYYNTVWAEKTLRILKAKILIFDWVKFDVNVNESLIHAAKRLNIPTVALPHGNHVLSCHSLNVNEVPPYGKTFLFDHIVAPSNNSRDFFVKGGIDQNKVTVIGSPRFSKEWINKYSSIYHEESLQLLPAHSNKLKVVYMEGGIRVLKDKEELIDTIRRINGLDFVDLIIKPKTRNNKIFVGGLENVARCVRDISSYSLCKWADVMIISISSIYIEALVQNIPLIHPKYLFDKTTVFEEMGSVWLCNSYDELEGALRALHKDHNYKTYSDKEVNALMRAMVYGGKENRDVLGDCYQFLLEKASVGE